jgi:hypothetical protein
MSEIKTNQISSLTGSNSDITLDPDGTGDVVVASGHKLGIGTTSPALPLEVNGSTNVAVFRSDASNSIIQLANSTGTGGDNGTLIGSVGDDLYLRAGDAERVRIDSSGRFLCGTTDTTLYNNTSGQGFVFDAAIGLTQMLRSGGVVASMNRATNDGTILQFYGQGSLEGSIAVSGSTVSYNGGHLARWSQLADNTKDTSIVKGTVMTNLDQMAEWTKDGVTEDNEQLNCMAVSSVEGDANVAGVFVNWDDDDEDYTADMNIAMTGDMVIRIASGTTVARGDLLMSAGDGTAKPQGDDIVRSKTIAKVTSTTVSHTYDDGSYLVPCVLMAC